MADYKPVVFGTQKASGILPLSPREERAGREPERGEIDMKRLLSPALSSYFEEERERKRGCALEANLLPNRIGHRAAFLWLRLGRAALYRRFLTCNVPPASNIPPIANRRYSRFKICAPLNTYRLEERDGEKRDVLRGRPLGASPHTCIAGRERRSVLENICMKV
jgi:hypothetical protein